jgi:hypothetical protein
MLLPEQAAPHRDGTSQRPRARKNDQRERLRRRAAISKKLSALHSGLLKVSYLVQAESAGQTCHDLRSAGTSTVQRGGGEARGGIRWPL